MTITLLVIGGINIASDRVTLYIVSVDLYFEYGSKVLNLMEKRVNLFWLSAPFSPWLPVEDDHYSLIRMGDVAFFLHASPQPVYAPGQLIKVAELK